MPSQLTASKSGLCSSDGRINLALGLLEIGKPWGRRPGAIPTEDESFQLLERAWELGIRHFDTAPSYDLSEARFGRFLSELASAERNRVFVTTKFGDHWDTERGEAYVDHSYDALKRSLDASLALLGPIDLLQLHKTTPAVLGSLDLERALDYARSVGVKAFGVSIKDHDSANRAIASGVYQTLQLPFNAVDTQFTDVVRQATAANIEILVNRPFGMGRLLDPDGSNSQSYTVESALRFILQQPLRGLILIGTKSLEHLAENVQAFRVAADG